MLHSDGSSKLINSTGKIYLPFFKKKFGGHESFLWGH